MALARPHESEEKRKKSMGEFPDFPDAFWHKIAKNQSTRVGWFFGFRFSSLFQAFNDSPRKKWVEDFVVEVLPNAIPEGVSLRFSAPLNAFHKDEVILSSY